MEALLAGIWAVYVLQLVETLIMRPGRDVRDRMLAIAIDVLSVLLPLAAFLLVGTHDQKVSTVPSGC